MSCKLVRFILWTVFCTLILGVTASAQTVINYQISPSSGIGSRTLQELRNRAGLLGYNYNETNIILYNNDSTLGSTVNSSAFPVVGYGRDNGLDSIVTLKSNVAGEKRTVQVTNNRLFILNDYTTGDGIPATFSVPHLVIESDIIISGNKTANLAYETVAGGISLYCGTLQADGVTFDRNYYSAIESAVDRSTVLARGATFQNNQGAAVIDYYYGGAITARNADFDLRGADFHGNTTASTDAGGAIYLSATDGQTSTLQLGSYQGKSSEFSGNYRAYDYTTNQGQANSLLIYATNSSFAQVLVDVEDQAYLNLRDPMKGIASGATISIQKTGSGAWRLEGNNDFTQSQQTTFNVGGGTVQFLDGASLNLVDANYTMGSDSFTVASGAILEIEPSYSGTDTAITTSYFRMDRGSRLNLDGNLNLGLRGNFGGVQERGIISSTISGHGDLIKTGEGSLTFSGSTSNFFGDVLIQEGGLKINSQNTLQTAGKVDFADGTVLSVAMTSVSPAIKANQIMIGADTIFTVSGVTGTENYVVLEAAQAITGDFSNDYSASDSSVDYLRYAFGFSNDRRQFLGSATLAWNYTDGTAHGTFTIEGNSAAVPNHFTVSQELRDKTGNAGWNGHTLTKKGSGTLEMAVQNSYSGPTNVEQGTLLLSHSGGVGLSSIYLSDETKLVLDFQDKGQADFGNLVADAGTGGAGGSLTKRGDGTIRLTNTANTYSGGTYLEKGVLEFTDTKVFGAGPIVFTGGILRNTVSGEFDQKLTIDAHKKAYLDVLAGTNWTIVSEITGAGDLVKSGTGTLTMAGTGSYSGDTTIEAGTLVVTKGSALGGGRLLLADNTVLQSRSVNGTDAMTIANNIVLEKAGTGKSVGNKIDTKNDLTLSGVISGNGTLIKTGNNTTLTLSEKNTYSGGTVLQEGTIEISATDRLGTGSLTFAGGTLQNTAVIDNFATSIILEGTNSAKFCTDKDFTLTSSITGQGGLIKTGQANMTMNGTHTYLGNTLVQEGTFTVDGRVNSKTIIYDEAVLTGAGTIGSDVVFQDGAVYEWFCSYLAKNSHYLTVTGNVSFNGAIFRPVTAGVPDYYIDPINGRTVLRYFGSLAGEDERFAEIDESYSPFYDFELDYSRKGYITVTAQRRDEARALSDSVATGLMMAQRRAHRRTYDRIDKSFREARYQESMPLRRFQNRPQQEQVRGQQAQPGRNLWGDLYGRATDFESTYYAKNDWRLRSFGLQAGYSLNATADLDWGITGGLELPELKNFRDKIEATDGFIGLYYGRRFQRLWEMKAYIGGGSQCYDSHRDDTQYVYTTRYYGESFQTNIELARPIRFCESVLRPYVGFDLEYASQQAAYEKAVSTEYRHYSGASLTQMFFRVGLDLEKMGPRGDIFLGVAYANMIGGDTVPTVNVYYPFAKMKAQVRGSHLGQNVFTIRGGGNRYLNEKKSQSLFLNLTSDIYADRAGGQAEFTGSVGYDWRF